MQTLISATADGSGDAIQESRGDDLRITGTVYVTGTLDGATAGIEVSPDGINWVRPTSLAFTTMAAENIEYHCKAYRGYVAGAGANTNVTVQLAYGW